MGAVNQRGGGKLYFDFRYLGVRCREYTKLNNTPANLKRAQLILEKLEAEITLDTFRYEKYFPKSKFVERFKEHENKIEALRHGTPLFCDFVEVWFTSHS